MGAERDAGAKLLAQGRRAAAKGLTRPGKRQIDLFLDALAETSNVAASARAAGLGASAFYRERRRSGEFAARWHEALCEGFVRLETELLSDALVAATGNVKDATLKARAQKYRLGLALLAAHRAAVRGAKPVVTADGDEVKDAKLRLTQRLMDMRERADGALVDGCGERDKRDETGAPDENEDAAA